MIDAAERFSRFGSNTERATDKIGGSQEYSNKGQQKLRGICF
jgi:hypothetical protein